MAVHKSVTIDGRHSRDSGDYAALLAATFDVAFADVELGDPEVTG